MTGWSGRSSDRPIAVFVPALALALAISCQATPPEPDTPFEPPKPYTARALRDITVPRTPERVARGKYLSEGLLQCFICHSERDWDKPGAPPIEAKKGAGLVWPGRPWLVAANITPDPETGTGKWTDDMLLRAIREGIGHDGRALHSQMWSYTFHPLPDDDAEAVVAYLRTLRPIRNQLPRTAIPPEAIRDLDLNVLEPITRLRQGFGEATADPVQRGRRLASLAGCGGCHTSWYTPRNPGLFGGGNHIERSGRKTYSANITFAASGLAHYDAALFREVMRTGRMKGRELSPLMPWIVFRNLSDDDLDALFAYLKAMPPVKHVIDNVDAVTKCEICGGEHPLGRYNKLAPPKRQEFSLAAMRDTVGVYRFEDGFEVRVAIVRGRLSLRFKDGGRCPLETEDGKIFFCDGDIDRLEFVRDAAGHVTSVINNRTDAGQRIR